MAAPGIADTHRGTAAGIYDIKVQYSLNHLGTLIIVRNLLSREDQSMLLSDVVVTELQLSNAQILHYIQEVLHKGKSLKDAVEYLYYHANISPEDQKVNDIFDNLKKEVSNGDK